jgi:hypothetical protein
LYSSFGSEVDEGRKRVLLIATAILAARKLSQFDGGKRAPATVAATSDAVRWAEEIMSMTSAGRRFGTWSGRECRKA